ncbi:MAG: molybdopterin-dependent oxidoreductase [Pseudomonadota bacterium]
MGQGQPPVHKTTCPYCGVGCGVLARRDGETGLSIKGDPDHPANFGRLCSKGSALGDTLALEGRLLAPEIMGEPVSWDRAISEVATKFKRTIAEHGPDSVAFYVSGQLLTEDYYVANKLMKGYIGSANIDTNSRLCMASSVAGHKRAFGADTVPGLYEDLEEADLIVLVGSNLAWCHPVLFQRIQAAQKAKPGMKLVNIDPRRTATSEASDMHLGLEPGSDVALFNGLLARIAERGAVNEEYVTAYSEGFETALVAAKAENTSATGIDARQLSEFYDLWIDTPKVVTIYSQGVNQSTSGSDKVNAILNCHIATGRIGRTGTGPFSVTGQPNAMGGREVGGLANMLACHLDIEIPDHRAAVQAAWDSPVIASEPGLKAIDMFRAVADDKIKALWIMCTNPAVSLPEADMVRSAIAGCDFVAVSDMFGDTDTAQLADVVLPATGWAEKDGTVTNSERCISRQRGILPAPGEARHDWKIICDVGRAMGWQEAFDFASPADIFREHAGLSGVAGALGRDFDISAFSDISDADYDALEPFHWPQSARKSGGRFFAEGGFFTPTGKARLLPVSAKAPARAPDADYPFRLNTGRVRDHWHTMTRTAMAARLSQHIAEPFLEIHPIDAHRIGVKPADLAEVTSPHGQAVLRVVVTDRVSPGNVFAPMHWTGVYASDGRIDALVEANTDPVSGQPESKASPVAIVPFAPAWYGFAVSAKDIVPDTAYWAKARVKGGWRMELAGRVQPENWEGFTKTMFGAAGANTVSFSDPARGTARVALMEGDRVIAALFSSPEPVAVARGYIAEQLSDPDPQAEILAARPGADRPDAGAIICACFDVGVNTITHAILDRHLSTVDQIGAAVRAGTNCGSCRSELQVLLNRHSQRLAAE